MEMRHQLAAARLRVRMSQGSLAKRLGVSRILIQKVEGGERRATPHLAAAWARATQCPEVAHAYCRECPVGQYLSRCGYGQAA